MAGQTSWRRLFGDNYSSSYCEPTLIFNTRTFGSSSSSYIRLSSRVQFIMCVGHKIVKGVVYPTMNPLEFLVMSPLFYNDGDSCSVIVIYYGYCE